MISAADHRSHSREGLFCVALLVALVGCSRAPAPVQLAGSCMGTSWHVTYVRAQDLPSPETLQAGIEAILEEIEQSMSTYRADSEITLFNALPVNTWYEVSADFYTVLSTALAVGRASGGAYDVTVGPLVDLWGFGPGPRLREPPTDIQVKKRLAEVGQDRLRLDGERRSVLKSAPLSLDFSSIAKGYAVDRVANWLEQQGVGRFLVEVGGEMRVAGLSHRGDPWLIAIEKPDSTQRSVLAAVGVTDAALATSGDYRNYFELDGRRYSHTIDPRNGYPVAHDLVSVTVIHPGAVLADAWATALTVLGSEQALTVAQAQGLAVYFIRREGDGFSSSYTEAFKPYLRAEEENQ